MHAEEVTTHLEMHRRPEGPPGLPPSWTDGYIYPSCHRTGYTALQQLWVTSRQLTKCPAEANKNVLITRFSSGLPKSLVAVGAALKGGAGRVRLLPAAPRRCRANCCSLRASLSLPQKATCALPVFESTGFPPKRVRW